MSSKLTKVGYDLKDVSIVQAPISYCNHRGDVDPFMVICGRINRYPVFVSPMASVTNQYNYREWIDAGFTPVVPRSVAKSDLNPDGLTFKERVTLACETFVSFSLQEANDLVSYFDENGLNDERYYICIDIANGVISDLYKVCKELKSKWGDMVEIMTGNTATPLAYSFYADAGIDWIRMTVGSGSRCTSGANVGVYYPSATLIDETQQERERWIKTHDGPCPSLILDGGVKNFDDIQKALALGADAVMGGGIFARAEEACGPIVYLNENNLNMSDAIPKDEYFKKLDMLKEWDVDAYEKLSKRKPYREYYGMSTKKAQKITGGKGNKTSEGINVPTPVLYPIKKWAENMESYLRSAMTYTDSQTLDDFRKNTELIILGGGDGAYRK